MKATFLRDVSRLLVAAVVVLAPAALGSAAQRGGQTPAGLDPMEPPRCSGNQELTIRDRYISTRGNGVEVSGNCEVTIVDSHIVADGVAVLVQGNGQVEIVRSHLEGGAGGLQVADNAAARFRGSVIAGGVTAVDFGELVDEGDNSYETTATVSAGTAVTIGADGVVISDESGTVTVGPDGVIVSDRGGTVTIDGGYVRVESAGTVVEVDSAWRISPGGSHDTASILRELGAVEESGELRIDLAGDVLFDYDSVDVRPDAAAQLAKIAHVLRDRSTGEITVIGHTDARGSEEYNAQLSEARAVAVMRWLHQHEGIPPSLMRGKGMGAARPIDYNTMPDGSDNPAGRARNRRVEITFATRS